MPLPDALASMAGEPVWVAWSSEGGRKVPKSPYGGNAKSNDPATWGTYAEAAEAAEKNGYSGVGIMLSDGLVGIDLDDVVADDGTIEPWAQKVIDGVGSYAEVSPSGSGVHVLAYADPASTGAVGRANHAKGIEVYNHGRYFTVTGDQIAGEAIASRTREVLRLLEEQFGGESAEDRLRKRVGGIAKDQVRRRANETTLHNAKRDKLRYARVPMGGETCGFCMMLASRGFVYHSAQTAGEGNHYHHDCRCKVVPGFDGMEVEGYDLDYYKGIYYDNLATDSSGSVDLRGTLRNIDRANAEAKKVDVEIDGWTPCLKRVSDGKILKTSTKTLTPSRSEFKDWEFNWAKPVKDGYTVTGLYVDGDERVQGLIATKDDPNISAVYVGIVEAAPFNSPHNKKHRGSKEYSGVGAHLFAEAVKESIELGYDGFVVFEAKTGLIRYYTEALGAIQIGGSQRMFIDEEAGRRLYERYFGNSSR